MWNLTNTTVDIEGTVTTVDTVHKEILTETWRNIIRKPPQNNKHESAPPKTNVAGGHFTLYLHVLLQNTSGDDVARPFSVKADYGPQTEPLSNT